ncbi:MAG: polysaccharide deacetylase family protein [Planctomycetes bacterium]|nr:polysaccharide deacetylase family protein [Planctomycetota bacterium]
MTSGLQPAFEELVQRMAPEKSASKLLLENIAMNGVGRLGALLNIAFGSRADTKPGILTYHRIAPRIAGIPFPSHNVTPQVFRNQITGLLRRGYVIRPLREVLDWHRDNVEPPARTVVVTFDDGFESVHSNAWPVLRELNVPATIFINTAFLDSARPFPFDHWAFEREAELPPHTYRPLTTDQCREMAESGLIELGAHTHTHQDFRGRVDEFERDLQLNLDELAKRFRIEAATFAYPVGSPHRGFAGGELLEAVRRTNLLCALTTESVLVDVAHDPFQWGRFNVFPWDTSATLSGKLGGWYSWAPKVRRQTVELLRHILRVTRTG